MCKKYRRVVNRLKYWKRSWFYSRHRKCFSMIRTKLELLISSTYTNTTSRSSFIIMRRVKTWSRSMMSVNRLTGDWVYSVLEKNYREQRFFSLIFCWNYFDTYRVNCFFGMTNKVIFKGTPSIFLHFLYHLKPSLPFLIFPYTNL